MLKKAKSLIKKEISLEEALEIALDEYIERHDPLEKAKRSQARIWEKDKASKTKASKTNKTEIKQNHGNRNPNKQNLSNASHEALRPRSIQPDMEKSRTSTANASREAFTRRPLTAALKYRIFQRDEGRCRFEIKLGTRCTHTKYLDIHHVLPVH